MRLIEIAEKKPDGTYAGVHFSEDTQNAIVKYCKDNKLPNAVPAKKLHTTLLYSRKYCPDFKPEGELDKALIGEPEGFDVWETQKSDDDEQTRCLVLEYDCPELTKRHKFLRKEYGATHDYPDFKVHVTFSYDIGDIDEDDLPEFDHKIEIVEEYGEDLDLNWATNNTSKKKKS